jgi:hypothetical protein
MVTQTNRILWLALAASVAMSCPLCAATTHHKSAVVSQPTTPPPIVVQVQQPQATPEQVAAAAQDRKEREATDEATIETNHRLILIGIGQGIIFVLQLIVFGYQAAKLRATVTAAETQSADMKQSIKEAARAAAAMEVVAENMGKSAATAAESVATLKDRTALQLRAYLTVIIGGATYQDRSKSLKFDARPLLVNNGNTPAYNVSYAANASILPVPLPPDHKFTYEEESPHGSVVGAHQNSIMGAVVPDYVDDATVENIKLAIGSALYVWGVMSYKDVFDELHQNHFCQQIYWQSDGKIAGFYVRGLNDAS